MGTSARKPSPPMCTPRMGTRALPMMRAVERMVPSPPMEMIVSTCFTMVPLGNTFTSSGGW